MTVAIVDSGVANLASVMAAIKRIGVEAEVTSDADKIQQAKHVILPGVGSAQAAMAQVAAKNLADILRYLTQPVLGICLGMQMLFMHSQEGDVPCLGIIPGNIAKLPEKPDLPIPHMGWNQIQIVQNGHPLLRNIPDNSFVYFVHSYAVSVGDATLASCNYGGTFSAIVGYKNFFGCQFHPERSGTVGFDIIKNFLSL